METTWKTRRCPGKKTFFFNFEEKNSNLIKPLTLLPATHELDKNEVISLFAHTDD